MARTTKRDNLNTFNAAFLREFSRITAAATPTYRTDSKGRRVRVFSADAPLTAEIVRFFYLNERTVEETDALETIGYNGLQYALKSGYLVRDERAPNLLWLTTRAQAAYSLPRPRVGKFLNIDA